MVEAAGAVLQNREQPAAGKGARVRALIFQAGVEDFRFLDRGIVELLLWHGVFDDAGIDHVEIAALREGREFGDDEFGAGGQIGVEIFQDRLFEIAIPANRLVDQHIDQAGIAEMIGRFDLIGGVAAGDLVLRAGTGWKDSYPVGQAKVSAAPDSQAQAARGTARGVTA